MVFPVFPHFSAGPVLVSWGATAEAADDLGYSMNGVEISEIPRYQDVMNDGFGGAGGVPSDAQFLGAIAQVRCVLNRFTEANVEALSQLDSAMGGTDGTLPDIGDFVKQDSLAGVLVLSSPVETRTYTLAFVRQGRAFNSGVPHRQYQLVFECWIDDPCTMELWAASAGDNPCAS